MESTPDGTEYEWYRWFTPFQQSSCQTRLGVLVLAEHQCFRFWSMKIVCHVQ